MACPFIFIPINENSQRYMCSLINLPLVLPHRQRTPKLLTTPTNLHQILADGNCLFWALLYVITGRQVYHCLVRQKILSHMREIENLLRPHMNMPLSDYIQSTGMAQERVWGTDIEIFVACSLLSTDIYVYSNCTWYNIWMLDGSQNTCSRYIQHTSGVHYYVVLDVNLSTNSDTMTFDECAKRQISSVCSLPRKKLLRNESKVHNKTETTIEQANC